MILLLLLLLATPAWAFTTDGQEDKCADAAVAYCDNFEAHSLGSGNNTFWHQTYYKQLGYVLGSGSIQADAIIISDATKCKDSKCLQVIYPANSSGGANLVQDYGIGTGFPFGISDVYIRWYVKWGDPAFRFSSQSTKNLITLNQLAAGFTQQAQEFNCYFIGVVPCQQVLILQYADSFPGQQNDTPPNMNLPQPIDVANTWICYEMRMKGNTSTHATDGIIDWWINDVQYAHYTGNIDNRGGASLVTGVNIAGVWNCDNGDTSTYPCPPATGPGHPLQSRFLDNFVISSAPIGCSTTTAVDTTPPAKPTGLQVQ